MIVKWFRGNSNSFKIRLIDRIENRITYKIEKRMSSLLTEFLNPISIEIIPRKDNIEKNKYKRTMQSLEFGKSKSVW